MQARYTSLPGAWPASDSRKTTVTVNNYSVPVVPAVCSLLIIIGLPMWAAGMLQARSSTDALFNDLGITHESLDRLKGSVLAAVLVLVPLVAGLLGVNIWLEVSRPARPAHQETGLSLSSYTSSSTKVNAANWLALLLVALMAVTGSIMWLSAMQGALSATQQAGGGGGGGPPTPPWWPPAAPAAAPPPPPAAAMTGKSNAPVATMQAAPEAEAVLLQLQQLLGTMPAAEQGQQWYSQKAALLQQAAAAAPAVPTPSSGDRPITAAPPAAPHSAVVQPLVGGGTIPCPPGCVDLGFIASIMGLPWGCFCNTRLLAGITARLHAVVGQLSVAVAGALLLFIATSWLFGYLAAQGVHAERDLEELMRGGNGVAGLGVAPGVAAAAPLPHLAA